MSDKERGVTQLEPTRRDGGVAGVIGLGDIGRGVATNLAKAKHALAVCDVRREAAAQFEDRAIVAADPSELARACDVVVIAVLDDAQVLDVTTSERGVLASSRPGSVLLVLSTVTLDTLKAVASRANEVGVGVLDCSVSGGPVAAQEGSLVAMIGGDESLIERVGGVLEAFCCLVVRMGPLGAGLRAKLARNLVQYGSWLAAYEGQLLAEAAGIDLQKLAHVIRVSDEKIGGASRLMFRSTASPFAADDDPDLVGIMQAAANLAHKDLRAALRLAKDLGVELPLAAMTEARTDALFGLSPDPASAESAPPPPRDCGEVPS